MNKKIFILLFLLGCNKGDHSNDLGQSIKDDAKTGVNTSSSEFSENNTSTSDHQKDSSVAHSEDVDKVVGVEGKDNMNNTHLQNLEINDIKAGTGVAVEAGDRVYVEYTGSLSNDSVFDSNMNNGKQPFGFNVGAGEVIEGWDKGLLGMKEGGMRSLKIPSSLGYGAAGAGGVIPPNADLKFDVKLLKVVKRSDNFDLISEDIIEGTGKEAVKGKSVTVHYKGTFINGVKFDASYDRDEPFTIKLGENRVIAGWEQGLLGMKAGGKRKLIIPPHLGYGTRGAGSIAPGQILVFEIELLEVKN